MTSSRTREFSACFTTECGNPDILKSMFTSLNVKDEPTFGMQQAGSVSCGKWRHKKAQCRRRTEEANVWSQRFKRLRRVRSNLARTIWLTVVQNAFARRTSHQLLFRNRPGGTLCDAQGHMIEAHGTRTDSMTLGPEGQSVGAEFRVMNVKSPIFSMEMLVKQGVTGLRQDRPRAKCRKVIAKGRWTL